MRTLHRHPLLYGPSGKPIAGNLYPCPEATPTRYRNRGTLQRSIKANVNSRDRSMQVSNSRQLFARLGNLGSAILDKNWWAFGDGWEPTYTGANKDWGLVVESWLREQFMPNCDRQGRWDWQMCLYLSGIAWDRDGDDCMILTEDGNHFPKVDFIPATRIANGNDSADNFVHGDFFDGYRIFDGIIYDDTGASVGCRVLGESMDGSGQETYSDFSLGRGGTADLAFLPEWSDQGRGIPLVSRIIHDGFDSEDIDEFLKRGIKRASAVGLITKNEEGEMPVGNEVVTSEEETDSDDVAQTVYSEEIDGGEMYYIRSDGESIEGLNYSNPHPNVEAFIARIERRMLRAVGWSYELINLAESGRAATRLVCDLGNQSIWKNQKLGYRRTWRAVRYAIAKGIKEKFIPPNPDPRDKYFAWEFSLPKQLSVDAGNDEQAARENIKFGISTAAIECGKRGYHYRDIKRQRGSEIIANDEEAQRIEKTTGGRIPYDKALEMLEQRAANPVAQAPQAAQAPEKQEE